MSLAIAALDDAALDALEDAVHRARWERQRVESAMHIALPSLDTLDKALYYAVDWMEPAYIYDRDSVCMVHPHGHACAAAAYPDGRIVLCHAAAPSAKWAKALADLRAKWHAISLQRMREIVADDVDAYLWYHGRRIGRRQLRHATRPDGGPWTALMGSRLRVWRRYGSVSPITRHNFFRIDTPGARCLIWYQDGMRYGSPYVLLPGETSPVEGLGITKKRAKRAGVRGAKG